MKFKDLYGVATSATVAATSSEFQLGDLRDLAIGVQFSSATLAGTLKLQCSIWDGALVRVWVDVLGSSQAITAGEPHVWNIIVAAYPLVRVVWTPSAGAGTIQARVGLKVFPTVEGTY